MKRLRDTKMFSGQSETITLTDLRMQPGDVFAQVQMGKRFIVTKNGAPVADIIPHELDAFELGALARKVK